MEEATTTLMFGLFIIIVICAAILVGPYIW